MVGAKARHSQRPGSLIPKSNTPPLSRRADVDDPVRQCSGERTKDGSVVDLWCVSIGRTPSFVPGWGRWLATPSFPRPWESIDGLPFLESTG